MIDSLQELCPLLFFHGIIFQVILILWRPRKEVLTPFDLVDLHAECSVEVFDVGRVRFDPQSLVFVQRFVTELEPLFCRCEALAAGQEHSSIDALLEDPRSFHGIFDVRQPVCCLGAKMVLAAFPVLCGAAQMIFLLLLQPLLRFLPSRGWQNIGLEWVSVFYVWVIETQKKLLTRSSFDDCEALRLLPFRGCL